MVPKLRLLDRSSPSRLRSPPQRIAGSPQITEGAAMQRIAGWLQTLGMSEYAQRFAENDIDVTVLPHLTDQDLKELGVSLGHR